MKWYRRVWKTLGGQGCCNASLCQWQCTSIHSKYSLKKLYFIYEYFKTKTKKFKKFIINNLTHTININVGAITTTTDVNTISTVKMGLQPYIMVGSRADIRSNVPSIMPVIWMKQHPNVVRLCYSTIVLHRKKNYMHQPQLIYAIFQCNTGTATCIHKPKLVVSLFD